LAAAAEEEADGAEVVAIAGMEVAVVIDLIIAAVVAAEEEVDEEVGLEDEAEEEEEAEEGHLTPAKPAARTATTTRKTQIGMGMTTRRLLPVEDVRSTRAIGTTVVLLPLVTDNLVAQEAGM